MKKVTLLCLQAERDRTLEALRDLGLLHLAPVQPPESADIDATVREIERAHEALTLLDQAQAPAPAQHAREEARFANPSELAERVHALAGEQNEIEEELLSIEAEMEVAAPFGDFDPAVVHQLEQAGLAVTLYQVPAGESPPVPDGAHLFTVQEEAAVRYVVLIGAGGLPPPAEALPLPRCSQHEFADQSRKLERRMAELDAERRVLARQRAALVGHLDALRERRIFAEAQAGMARADRIAYLQGYCPAERLDALHAATAENGWGLLVEDPAPHDAVPTLVHYPRWVKPIKAVFDVLGILPGYHEADISSVFLPFFSVFFALLIGDAGYGLLFLILTLAARRRMKRAPAYPFALLKLLSIATIAWGVVTGNVFGIHPEVLPVFMQQLQIPWLTAGEAGRDNLMRLCFLIGATHITIAHLWNAAALLPDLRAIAQFGWIAVVWCMYFIACGMVLGAPFPPLLVPLFIAGALAIVLFMTPRAQLKSEWINHAMLPLSVVSALVDVISYIRLFAVGMASMSVAQSFNDMALGLGFSRIWTIPVIALILLLGHVLNILLCALGILVHGVRLNTLEFSLHKGMQWSGIPYIPFAGTKTN